MSCTFAYVLNQGTKADNYEIEQVPGTLTVRVKAWHSRTSPPTMVNGIK